MAQQYSSYIAVLLGESGDPAFANRFKEVIKPLLGRFVLPSEGVSKAEGHIIEEFYLSGIVAAVQAWIADGNRLPIDQFVYLILRTALPGSADATSRASGR